ncbi:MAG: phage Gp37/Gp68 family protein [Cyanobacteriota bacterium]
MTSIEWTDRTWNVVTGCTPISSGCKNCYAEGIAKRFWGDRKFSDVQFHEDRLLQPLSWKKPQKIFVNSMSDLFHEKVTDEQLDRIFAVMALAHWQTFQVLTKRPQRALDYLSARNVSFRIARAAWYIKPHTIPSELQERIKPHLPNVWLGVTCENQKTANERIPLLINTPAAVRFLSCEPLLEKINIQKFFPTYSADEGTCGYEPNQPISWVIIGGESGHNARICHIDWIRSIVSQCQAADVQAFVKQLGSSPLQSQKTETGFTTSDIRLKNRKGGDTEEFPDDLKIREFPEN